MACFGRCFKEYLAFSGVAWYGLSALHQIPIALPARLFKNQLDDSGAEGQALRSINDRENRVRQLDGQTRCARGLAEMLSRKPAIEALLSEWSRFARRSLFVVAILPACLRRFTCRTTFSQPLGADAWSKPVCDSQHLHAKSGVHTAQQEGKKHNSHFLVCEGEGSPREMPASLAETWLGARSPVKSRA